MTCFRLLSSLGPLRGKQSSMCLSLSPLLILSRSASHPGRQRVLCPYFTEMYGLDYPLKTLGAMERPNGRATNWKSTLMYFWSSPLIEMCRYASFRYYEVAHIPFLGSEKLMKVFPSRTTLGLRTVLCLVWASKGLLLNSESGRMMA